uniref:Fucolectin tachylectin-4 pentraxin-1 domain-containing protein n=1 Tax=Oncorhynchus mykiss TaxID=8022 RepID=A0A8C7VAN2_ONCMY
DEFCSELSSLFSFWPTVYVALGGKAAQSSTFYGGTAKRSLDGIWNSTYEDHSCSHTLGETNPWWRVDLPETYQVPSVTITNRDTSAERINGAEIRIGNSLENDGNSNPRCVTALSSYILVMAFQCRGIKGRYVNIFLSGSNKHLSLCEAEVNVGRRPENAATGGIASQSSQWDKFGDANNAIDLNWTNRYLEGSCSHTKDIDPWWRVDMSKTHNVTYVTITNRGDCCSDRISGAEIHVGDSLFNKGNSNPLCAGIPYIPAGQTRTFPCSGISGRDVNILLPGKEKCLTFWCTCWLFTKSPPLPSLTERTAAPGGRTRQRFSSETP